MRSGQNGSIYIVCVFFSDQMTVGTQNAEGWELLSWKFHCILLVGLIVRRVYHVSTSRVCVIAVIFKRKVKLILCLVKHHAMNEYEEWSGSSTHS